MNDDFYEGNYEPDDDEIRELDEILKMEQLGKSKSKNRIIYNFYTESHFSGWLRTHGIIW